MFKDQTSLQRDQTWMFRDGTSKQRDETWMFSDQTSKKNGKNGLKQRIIVKNRVDVAGEWVKNRSWPGVGQKRRWVAGRETACF